MNASTRLWRPSSFRTKSDLRGDTKKCWQSKPGTCAETDRRIKPEFQRINGRRIVGRSAIAGERFTSFIKHSSRITILKGADVPLRRDPLRCWRSVADQWLGSWRTRRHDGAFSSGPSDLRGSAHGQLRRMGAGRDSHEDLPGCDSIL